MTVLDQLRPNDLLGAWKLAHLLEASGGLSDGDAKYRKEHIEPPREFRRPNYLTPAPMAGAICS